MSAWEIAEHDVLQVLRLHGLAKHSHEEIVERSYDLVLEQEERVQDATYDFYDEDDKCKASLDEIETILMEEGVIQDNRKRFFEPEEENDGERSSYSGYDDDY